MNFKVPEYVYDHSCFITCQCADFLAACIHRAFGGRRRLREMFSAFGMDWELRYTVAYRILLEIVYRFSRPSRIAGSPEPTLSRMVAKFNANLKLAAARAPFKFKLAPSELRALVAAVVPSHTWQRTIDTE